MATETIIIDYKVEVGNLQARLKDVETQLRKTGDAGKKAAKETSDGIVNMGKITENIKSQFMDLGKGIIAAFAVERIIEFGNESVKAFQEAELNAKKLQVAVVSIGNEGSDAFEKLIKQSEELQKKSIFSDDSIQQAQTQLIQFGLVSDEVEKLIPKIVDLASATGTDLGSATETVIQGINGVTRGLKPLGINFKDTGDRAQNLAIITDKLNKYQGQSAAVLETSSGFLAVLANKYDDAKEAIGKFFTELVTGRELTKSETLEREQSGLNSLVTQLTNVNIKTEERKRLIGELQAKYPEFLKGLDSEKVSNEEIFKRLEKVNAQYLIKIGLQRFDERNKQALEDQADAQAKLFESLQKVNLEIAYQISAGDLAALSKARGVSPGDIEGQVKLAAAFGKNGERVQKLIDTFNEYRTIKDEAAKADKEANKILNERIGLQQFLEQQAGAVLTKEAQVKSSLGLTPEEQAKKEAELKSAKVKAEETKKKANEDYLKNQKEGMEAGWREMKAAYEDDKKFHEKYLSDKEKSDKDYFDSLKKGMQLGDEQMKAAYEEDLKNYNKFEDEKKTKREQLTSASFQIASDSISFLQNLNDIALQNELAMYQSQLDKKQISQEEFDQKQRDAKRKAAEENKQLATFNIILSTAQAVIAALTSVPPNVPLSIASGVAGLLQLAVVQSQPLPQFAKGTDYLKRNGHKAGIDTIPALLNEGEAIIPTDQNNKYPGLSKAWINGNLDKYILQNYVVPAIKEQQNKNNQHKSQSLADNIAKAIIMNQKGFYDGNIVEGLKMQRSLQREQIEILKQLKSSGYNPRTA